MKGKGYITFMVAAALSIGLAVTAMAEEPGSGEPGGAQLGNHDRDGGQVGAGGRGCSCYLPI